MDWFEDKIELGRKEGAKVEVVFEYDPSESKKGGDRDTHEDQSPSRKKGGRSEFESMAPGLRGFEPPEQRLARLSAEVAELLSMAEASASKETAPALADGRAVGSDASAVAAELRMLEQRLGGLARDSGDLWGSSSEAATGGRIATAGSLAVQLERLAAGGETSFDVVGSGDRRVTYEISYAPASTAATDNSKVAALEASLAAIEKQLGVFDQSCPFADLQTAVMQLQRRLSMLDGQQKFEAIKKLVGHAKDEVEAVLVKKSELEGVGSSPELDRKANELYEFCHRWSAVAPSLPTIVSRLQSLQALHQESASFSSRLAALEHQQEELAELLESTNVAVQGLSGALQENMTIVRDSMKSLEEKINRAVKA